MPKTGPRTQSGSLVWLWGLALGLVENSPGRSTRSPHHFRAGNTQMMRKTDRMWAGSQKAQAGRQNASKCLRGEAEGPWEVQTLGKEREDSGELALVMGTNTRE